MGDSLLIYGATGATGRRMAELAVDRGVSAIVAGRRAAELAEIAEPLACEARVAELDRIESILDGVAVVASCVGPYTHYGAPVLAAAVRAGAHYLDLTGEIQFVQRMIAEHDRTARDTGITIVPSAGLGLCTGLAARAACSQLSGDVDRITIGYRTHAMSPSTGTLRSSLEILAGGAAVVEHGQVRIVSPGSRISRTPLGLGTLFPLTDPLTMSTVWPRASIDSYLVTPVAPVAAVGMLAVRGMGRTGLTTAILRRLENRISGGAQPSGRFAATVVAEGGASIATATVEVDDIYEVTSQAALEVARCLLDGTAEPGARASASVVGDPDEVAQRVGMRLRVE